MSTARTNHHASLSHISIVDLSEPEKDTAAKLVDAASTHGFVYIKSASLEFTSGIIDHVFALVCFLCCFPSGCNQLMSVVVT